MWEKTRQDGTRKLKNNAVPTIFSFVKPKPKRKPPAERKMRSPKRRQIAHDEPGPSSVEEDVQPSSPQSDIVEEMTYTESASGPSSMTLQQMTEKLKKYEIVYKKTLQRAKKHQNELRKMKRRLNTMMRQNQAYIEDLQTQQILKKVFNT